MAWWKGAVGAGLVGVTGVVLAGRVELGHHSPAQVAWGSAIGAGLGCAWFGLVHKVPISQLVHKTTMK